MAIQFGYITMFAAAAPWASTLCLLNNAIERKADANRMLYYQQRPRYAGASGIGAWANVFEFLSFAVRTAPPISRDTLPCTAPQPPPASSALL